MRHVTDNVADSQESVLPELWDRQMQWTFKRDTYVSLIQALNDARRSLLKLTELRGAGPEVRPLAEHVLSGIYRANRDVEKSAETLSQQLDLASLVISKDVGARVRALISGNQNHPEMLLWLKRRLEECDQASAEVVSLAKIDLQLENESRFDGAKASLAALDLMAKSSGASDSAPQADEGAPTEPPLTPPPSGPHRLTPARR